jgi:RNA polymerase-binding transcription factor DksA
MDITNTLAEAGRPPVLPASVPAGVDGHGLGGPLVPALFDPVVHLSARRVELRNQLDVHLQALEVGEPHLSSHLAEEAQDHQQRQSIAAIRDILSFELQQVEHALARATQGLYGVCEDCAQPIAPRRLQVLPAVTLCVACQQRRESRARIQ